MKYDELVQQIQELDGSLTNRAASAVNVSLNIRNWMIGGWIVNYEQNGTDKAKYGERVIEELAKTIVIKGLSGPNLRRCRQFFLTYREIYATLSHKFESTQSGGISATLSHLFEASDTGLKGQTVSALLESMKLPESDEKSQTVSAKSVPEIDPEILITRLSFSQIVELLKIEDPLQRRFYEIEAIKGNWSVRELKRQIGSLLFERTGLSTDKEKLIRLTNEKANELIPAEFIRDPFVFEFIGLRPQEVVEESELEHLLLEKTNPSQNTLLAAWTKTCLYPATRQLYQTPKNFSDSSSKKPVASE